MPIMIYKCFHIQTVRHYFLYRNKSYTPKPDSHLINLHLGKTVRLFEYRDMQTISNQIFNSLTYHNSLTSLTSPTSQASFGTETCPHYPKPYIPLIKIPYQPTHPHQPNQPSSPKPENHLSKYHTISNQPNQRNHPNWFQGPNLVHINQCQKFN